MLHIRDKLLIDIACAFFEQVIYRFVMQIEGGAVDTGRGADFLDGDVCEVLLFQKRQKRLIYFRGCSEIFAFGFGQRETSSFLCFLPCSLLFFMVLLYRAGSACGTTRTAVCVELREKRRIGASRFDTVQERE